MINLYMSSATFGTNNNDTMHVCQIKTEEKSKLVIIKLSLQRNFKPNDWFVKHSLLDKYALFKNFITTASAIRISLFSNQTWQQQKSKTKSFNYLEEFKSTMRGH